MIKKLNAMASEMVGDGKKPNVFFVTRKGDVELITTDWFMAHYFWLSLPCNVETALEDRRYGVICSCEPKNADGKLVVMDNARDFLKLYQKKGKKK